MKEKNIKFLGEDSKEYTISPIEKVFCEKYIEFKGNGTKAILAAGFKTKNRKSASAMASRLLSKPHISQFLKLILKEKEFTTDKVNKSISELYFLIRQRKNLNVKVSAIKLYNKLTSRYKTQ